jgi:predicted nicotinamide N-methyase
MGKKKKKDKTMQRTAFGLTILKASHPQVRNLKKDYEPEIHGNKFWSSSYLIMDFLQHQGLPADSKVMEVGCGWGLAGIFCAKSFGAKVTGIDADDNVFPYLDLHAEVNGVKIKTKKARFEELKKKTLAKQDLIIGGDICFWDEMIDPLYSLVKKAANSGVGQIILADPGRPPFNTVCERSIAELGGETKAWSVDEPIKASGTLLIVGSLPL